MKNKKNKLSFSVKFLFFTLCFLFFFLLLIRLILSLHEQQFYQRMAAVTFEISKSDQDLSSIIYALKQTSKEYISLGLPILKSYGYFGQLLTFKEQFLLWIFAGLALCFLFTFFLSLLSYQNRQTQARIQSLTDYLKQINAGSYPLRPYKTEDSFSLLEDEIYKTIVMLRESQKKAIDTKENLAKNMADISHQLKTPLTSLSLTAELLYQQIEKTKEKQIVEQILSQTEHLRLLVTALLNLSRIDAGVLQLEQKEIPIEELLSCAAEPILPLLKEKQQKLQIQNCSEYSFLCDIGWTAEGISNILKNCCEHSPEFSTISITAFQNPIYTEIQIEDEGEGLDAEELSSIFQRFYKGKHSKKDSIGIGLALAKSIVERQNGEIFAENCRDKGARFRIRFYV